MSRADMSCFPVMNGQAIRRLVATTTFTSAMKVVRSDGAAMHCLKTAAILDTDCHTLTDLYAAFEDENVVMYAHVGGRYANIEYDHNPEIETAVEMHSAWGTLSGF